MKRLLRLMGWALGCVAALAIVAAGVVYAMSERALARTYDRPAASIPLPADEASIVEGRRLATVLGCVDACHGKGGRGAVMFDEPMVGRVVAPNLTASVRRHDDAQLVALIRAGVRPDGRSLMIMPSEAYAALNDADLGRILAYLRSLPAVEGPGPGVALGPLGRLGVAVGKFKPAAALVAESPPPPEVPPGEGIALGRYLARVACSHCHGPTLRGASNPDFTSPSLQVVASYSAEAFSTLMRAGVPLGGRELKTMGPVAREHFSHCTDAEIAALYAYLRALPPAAAN